jgi:hypothetical protein
MNIGSKIKVRKAGNLCQKTQKPECSSWKNETTNNNTKERTCGGTLQAHFPLEPFLLW